MAVRGLIAAVAFLTRLPVPGIGLEEGDFARAVRLYPLVGLVIGGIVAGAGRIGGQADPWLGALAATLAWIGVTGALHLDGLGDLADGLGAAHGDRGRLLAVMADPHIGSFGVVAIVMQIAVKLVTLHLLLPHGWAVLIAIPAAARLGPGWWARALPPLKPAGLGAAIADAIRGRDIMGWALVLAAACAILPLLLAVPLLVGGLGLWFRRRLGGMSGDVHGAGIELAEAGLLLAAAALHAA